MGQVEQSTRSTNRSFKRLIKVNGIKPEDIYHTMCTQTVELVFTAHPTQVQCPAACQRSNCALFQALLGNADADVGRTLLLCSRVCTYARVTGPSNEVKSFSIA